MQTPIFPSTLDLEMLVKELDEQFPDRMPELSLSDKEIAYRIGQISVVRYLKSKLTTED